VFGTYKRLSDDELSGSKQVEDIAKLQYYPNKCAFCWFMLHKILNSRNLIFNACVITNITK
jgi:hypothetical protein